MNIAMWLRAISVIPHIDRDEWQRLDIISRWLIATRAAVLVMTLTSSAIAGILAFQAGKFNFGLWLLLTIGLVFAHAANNLINDYVDYTKGVDQDNYYRAQYGPQPLVHGLMNVGQLLTFTFVTGSIALAAGLALVYTRGTIALILLLSGALFVIFYTFPLKYIALGEVSALIVWGPLMIGGGYYVITGEWSWNVLIASLPYALGVTAVIFGKHIDKYEMDKARHIYTIPVLLGEAASRFIVIYMIALQYLMVIYLVVTWYFTPALLLVLLALPTFLRILPMFRQSKPPVKPIDFPDIWPTYFVAAAFYHNRRFGLLFLLGLLLDTAIKVWPL